MIINNKTGGILQGLYPVGGQRPQPTVKQNRYFPLWPRLKIQAEKDANDLAPWWAQNLPCPGGRPLEKENNA
jgi:hypothetical protein